MRSARGSRCIRFRDDAGAASEPGRRSLLAGAAALALAPTAMAQPDARRQVAYLSTTTAVAAAPFLDALRAGLSELGYADGRNLRIAPHLGIELGPFVAVRRANDLDAAFASIGRSGAQAVLRLVDPVYVPLRSRTVELAARHRMPVMVAFAADVDAGGLMAYGADNLNVYRRAAVMVDKVLKGGNAGELAVERPTRFELALNRRTAQALGIRFSPNMLLRADRVIE